MNVSQLVVFFLCLITVKISGQNFTFTPGSDYEATLDFEMISEHYVYVAHDSPDTALISWRLMGNTCPEGWDIQMCDWQHCYIGLPNTGDMSPVAPGAMGNLRLLVNPFQISGAGDVHFWVYPTGLMEQHVDVIFHLQTVATNLGEAKKGQTRFNFSSDILTITGEAGAEYLVLDALGREVFAFKSTSTTHTEELQFLQSGVYYCKGNHGVIYRFLKPF